MTNAREIVSRCLQNDAAAQKQLYQHYAPQMLALCHRYTKDAHEASDVLQEGFVRVFRNYAVLCLTLGDNIQIKMISSFSLF